VVEVYYRWQFVERMPRVRGGDDYRIDYRHVIWSLVRKPGAFNIPMICSSEKRARFIFASCAFEKANSEAGASMKGPANGAV